jgi:hypothetical protein
MSKYNYPKLAVFGILGLLLAIAGLVFLHVRQQVEWGRERRAAVEKAFQPQIERLTEIFRKGTPAGDEKIAQAPELAVLAAPRLLGAYISYDTDKFLRYHWFALTEPDGFRGKIFFADGTCAVGRGTVMTSQRGQVRVVTYARKGTDAAGRPGEICLVIEE